MLEEDHYYPFGLTMAGISDKALKGNYAQNKKKFVGQLYDDDLDWDTYQFKFRTDDPQLGRFWQVDPIASKYEYNSPFAYAENKPINGIDMEGKEFWSMIAGYLTGDRALHIAGWTAMTSNLTNEVEGSMQANARLANGTSGEVDPHLPSQVHDVISTADKGADIVAATKPAVRVLQATDILASATPIGEAGVPVTDAIMAMTQTPKVPFTTPVEVTNETIANALKGSPMQSAQKSVSLPIVQDYVRMLEQGSEAPPIKVAGNVIIDGNHRYIAGRLVGKEPATVPGTMAPSQAPFVKPIQQVQVDPFDWRNF